MVARATAPNRLGPTSVFPDAGTWDFTSEFIRFVIENHNERVHKTGGLKGSPMASAPFWIAM